MKYKLVTFILIFLSILTVGICFFLYRTAPVPDPIQTPSFRKQEKMRIGGLKFYGKKEGRPVLNIYADSFTVEKKKIGVFRSGIGNTAKMVNVAIEIFAENMDEKKAFNESLSKSTFRSFPISLGNIPVLEAKSIKVTFFVNEKNTTQIQAHNASLLLKRQEILFQGAVCITSSDKKLETEKLSFFPKAGIFRTGKNYTLTKENAQSQGRGLTTDIFLDVVK